MKALISQVSLSSFQGRWIDVVGCHSARHLQYAYSHLANTPTTTSAAADKASTNKEAKYKQLSNRQICVPVAVESYGTTRQWN